MKRTVTFIAAGVLLLTAAAAEANLAGLTLQYHATYTPPGPTGNPNQGGTWAIGSVNTFNLAVPTWTDSFTLFVPNSQNRLNYKDLYLEVDYAIGARPAVAPAIGVTANGDFGPFVITPLAPVAGANDWTYHWTIVTQPKSETFTFPNANFFGLQNGVIGIEIGSNCPPLPEPASVCVIAMLGMIGLRRRPRR